VEKKGIERPYKRICTSCTAVITGISINKRGIKRLCEECRKVPPHQRRTQEQIDARIRKQEITAKKAAAEVRSLKAYKEALE